MAAKKVPDKMWTRKEMDRAEQMRLDGVPVDTIAEALRRSRNSIKACLKRLGVRLPDRHLDWYEALQENVPDAVVAARMGVVLSSVRGRRCRLRKRGFPIPDRRSLRYQRTP